MSSGYQIPPLSDAEWPEAIADLVDGFAGQLNVYRTMAHNPALLAAWAPLRDHVVRHNALGPEMTEVVILRTGVRLGSEYEWRHHVSRARGLGFDDARIASIRHGTHLMRDLDALLAQAVDELFDAKQLSTQTAQSVIARYGKAAMFDLMATVGFYSTLGYILKTSETPLDENIAVQFEERPFNPDG